MERKAVEVFNLTMARLFECDMPWAAISIVSATGGNPILSGKNRVGLLNLAFEDREFFGPSTPPDLVFNEDKAREILQFAAEMWPQIECLMVHCHAGMSRSPAVAAALEHIYHGNGSDNYWFEQKTPNMMVYRTILNTHYGVKKS